MSVGKFKVGDRVRVTNYAGSVGGIVGSIGTVVDNTKNPMYNQVNLDKTDDYLTPVALEGWMMRDEELELVKPAKSIVVRDKNLNEVLSFDAETHSLSLDDELVIVHREYTYTKSIVAVYNKDSFGSIAVE